MNTTTSAFLTGIIVIAGRWAQKKEMTVSIAVGVMVFAIMLAVLNSINEKLARSLGMLGVVAAMFVPVGDAQPNLIAIVKGIGWEGQSK